MNRQVLKILFDAMIALFLVVLAVDLLYLYFNGAWWDSIKAIEYTEVFILVIIVIIGIIKLIQVIKMGVKYER